jgi:hypothetical protein
MRSLFAGLSEDGMDYSRELDILLRVLVSLGC